MRQYGRRSAMTSSVTRDDRRACVCVFVVCMCTGNDRYVPVEQRLSTYTGLNVHKDCILYKELRNDCSVDRDLMHEEATWTAYAPVLRHVFRVEMPPLIDSAGIWPRTLLSQLAFPAAVRNSVVLRRLFYTRLPGKRTNPTHTSIVLQLEHSFT